MQRSPSPKPPIKMRKFCGVPSEAYSIAGKLVLYWKILTEKDIMGVILKFWRDEDGYIGCERLEGICR